MHSPLPITPHLSSFAPFPRLPGEIRNRIWKICVQDYPARIIDLREYRRKIDTHTREIAGFKSRAPRPTFLYTCRDSRAIAQASYIKAFGADMPAETWIDFEKDMLYLSSDLCHAALEGEVCSIRWPRYDTEREKLFGYFLQGNPFNQDIQKVKDLAITGLWELGLSPTGSQICCDITILVELFANLERFTLIEAQHPPDLTADLFLESVEPHHILTYDCTYQYDVTIDFELDYELDFEIDTEIGIETSRSTKVHTCIRMNPGYLKPWVSTRFLRA